MLASIAARNATLIPSGVRTQAASHPSGCKDREYFLYCKILHKIIAKEIGSADTNAYLNNHKTSKTAYCDNLFGQKFGYYNKFAYICTQK